MAKRDTNEFAVYRADVYCIRSRKHSTRNEARCGAATSRSNLAQQPRAATLHNRGRKLSVFLHASYARRYRQRCDSADFYSRTKIPRIFVTKEQSLINFNSFRTSFYTGNGEM